MTSGLHHLVDGDGPVVVLLHAGVADLRMWDAQAAALSQTRRVVRCDLRGFGQTPVAAGDEWVDADDVLALLAGLGVDRFDLVGASYGGGVALQVAAAAPGRVQRMVLIAPAADVLEEATDDLRAFGREEDRLLEAGDVDGATELNVTTWLGPDASVDARDLVRTMQRNAFERQLAVGDTQSGEHEVTPEDLPMPVSVVVGAHDLDFFVATAHELVRRLPDGHLVELPWAGHLPTLERPDEATALLLQLLG